MFVVRLVDRSLPLCTQKCVCSLIRVLLSENLVVQVLEAWNIALTAGFMLGRVIMITLVSILFIARVDTP